MIANRYDVILFDFDGTLCDTRRAVSACLVATVEGLTGRAPTDAEVNTVIGKGLSIRDTLRMLTGQQDRPGESDLESLVSTYRGLYPAVAASRSVLYAAVDQTLAAIAKRCVGCVVVSNKGGAAIRQTIEHFGIDHFAMVVAEHPDLPPKPHPALFAEVIKVKYPDVPLDRFVMVGDTVADIAFARNAGITSCWAAYGYGDPIACKAASPDYIARSMEDLAVLLWPQAPNKHLGDS